MNVSGAIDDVLIADLLQLVHLGRRSGTLRLERDDEVATITFHEGSIASARAPRPPYLGDLLVADGLATRAQVDEALRLQREGAGVSLGRLLVDRGLLTEAALREVVQRHVERTVCELLTWDRGSFRFTPEAAAAQASEVFPDCALPPLGLDTQMVLLSAARIFDERSQGRTPTEVALEIEPTPLPGAAPPLCDAPEPAPPDSAPPEPARPLLLQVLSADRRLAPALGHALDGRGVQVRQVDLAEAGAGAGGLAPAVLVDLRRAALRPTTLSAIRKAHPEAMTLALAADAASVAAAYAAGACAVFPDEPTALLAGLDTLLRTLRAPAAAESTPNPRDGGFTRLRRVLEDLRSGFVAATRSLQLLSIIADSLERAVLLLVRPGDLLVLGAFGQDPDGRPLAERLRGLALPLSGAGALGECLSTGAAKTLTWDAALLPAEFARRIGPPATAEVAVFPIHGNQGVIAAIYADNGRQSRRIEGLEVLDLATAQVGMAFENELLRRRAPRPE